MEQMPDYFRAVAVDYDGTLCLSKKPDAAVLEALAKLRLAKRFVVLVTGRIMQELRDDFPDAAEHFDAIVAENGAVLARKERTRALCSRVSEQLEAALLATGVPCRRGEVILALDSRHDASVRSICVQLGLDAQLVRNRDELMVLPAGISKATGLREALAELGVSNHSAIAIGDAENDIALLETCEIGVAVENAVSSLKQNADLVLDRAGSPAIAHFLADTVTRGLPGVQPRRRRVALGVTDRGELLSIPASRVQLFIDGPTGCGKSYVAGLFTERLVADGYSVCVLDQEGDHAALGQMHNVLSLGGREPLPPVQEVSRILRHGVQGVVLDTSLRADATKYAYARELLEELGRLRRESGLPHWIVVEEAHSVSSETLDRARKDGSLCLVTYHPDWLPAHSWQDADVLVTVDEPGHARLRLADDPRSPLGFHPAPRSVSHVRHRRKYAEGRVPFERGFTFRDAVGAIGTHVSSMSELASELARVPASALTHHAAHQDFSRWIAGVFQDRRLASAVAKAEQEYRQDQADLFRTAVRDLISLRYDSDGDVDCASHRIASFQGAATLPARADSDVTAPRASA